MRKTFKVIGIVLIIIVLIYALFIIEESIRLKKDGEYPLITNSKYCNKNGNINSISSNYEIKCNGLGYSIIREYSPREESSDIYYYIRGEFWLFDKYLLWGWIT